MPAAASTDVARGAPWALPAHTGCRGVPALRPNRPSSHEISATRISVLWPANPGRYFAAVGGSSDLVLELIADDEFGRVNPKIPEMKENIRPASARPDKPETTAVAGFQSTNRHELLVRLLIAWLTALAWAKGGFGKIGLQIEIDRDADHASAGGVSRHSLHGVKRRHARPRSPRAGGRVMKLTSFAMISRLMSTPSDVSRPRASRSFRRSGGRSRRHNIHQLVGFLATLGEAFTGVDALEATLTPASRSSRRRTTGPRQHHHDGHRPRSLRPMFSVSLTDR